MSVRLTDDKFAEFDLEIIQNNNKVLYNVVCLKTTTYEKIFFQLCAM